MDYTTVNDISDKVGEINFSGNIIPPIWFQTITNNKGRPHLLAIMILSEIVYWYRPVEERDEETGNVTGYRTKFRSDLLQKSYASLAEHYQVSKGQATDAVVLLEKIGVVQRVFRTVSRNGTLFNNVLFLRLNPDRLRELTFPRCQKAAEQDDSCCQKAADRQKEEPERTTDRGVDNVDNVPDNADASDNPIPLSRNFGIGCPEKTGEAPPKFRDTNTKITTKITDSILSQSVLSTSRGESDGQDRRGYRDLFAEQIGYDYIRCDYDYAREPCAVLDQLVEIAGNLLESDVKSVVIGGEDRPAEAVRNILLKLNMFHVRYTIKRFLESKKEIQNPRRYLLTCMINAFYEMDVKNAHDYARMKGG